MNILNKVWGSNKIFRINVASTFLNLLLPVKKTRQYDILQVKRTEMYNGALTVTGRITGLRDKLLQTDAVMLKYLPDHILMEKSEKICVVVKTLLSELMNVIDDREERHADLKVAQEAEQEVECEKVQYEVECEIHGEHEHIVECGVHGEDEHIVECEIHGEDEHILECEVHGEDEVECGVHGEDEVECEVHGEHEYKVECEIHGEHEHKVECEIHGEHEHKVECEIHGEHEHKVECEGHGEHEHKVECEIHGEHEHKVECEVEHNLACWSDMDERNDSSLIHFFPFMSMADEEFTPPQPDIKTGKEKNKRKKNKKKRRRNSSWLEDDSGDTGGVRKKQKNSPNHFVALEISSDEVRSRLREVQDKIIEKDERLELTRIKGDKFHVTLLVLRLETENDLLKATEVLDAGAASVHDRQLFGDHDSLEVRGVGHFNKRIVFADISPASVATSLSDTAELLCEAFESAGLTPTDQRRLRPHVTIMKMSKNPARCRKLGLKHIDSCHLEEFSDISFGQQRIEAVQLCEMLAAQNGYYVIKHTVSLLKSGRMEPKEPFPD